MYFDCSKVWRKIHEEEIGQLRTRNCHGITSGEYDSESGRYYFSYTDDNDGSRLSPYTEYVYQIQTLRATEPSESIYSEPMSCRTKTDVGYPSIKLAGLNDNGQLPIFPDSASTATVIVESAENYRGISHCWQKLENGSWVDLAGRTSPFLTISNAGTGDKGTYRCRINVIYYDEAAAQNYYISAYSDSFTTSYSKRPATYSMFTASEHITTEGGEVYTGLTTSIELYSNMQNHIAAPTGYVTFTVRGTDYEYSETVKLVTSDSTKYLGDTEKYYSNTSLTIKSLPVGVYSVTAYYGGSKVFKDMETSSEVLVEVGDADAYRLTLATKEGGMRLPKLYTGRIFTPPLTSFTKKGIW
ncbi:MAG TPA: Ig-like domain repeat protein [Clostridiales bacterium]|nr:Ig-like domain repeat protein [Clostridiales bacterium]